MNTNLILKRPVHMSHEARREKEAVRRLLTFERFARNNQLWDQLPTIYSPDAHVKASWFEGSIKDFITALAKLTNHIPYHLHTCMVWTYGSRAVAIAETTFPVKTVIDGVEFNQSGDSQYLYRLVRTNGEWYITDCESILEELPGKSKPEYLQELYMAADNWLLKG